MATPKMISLRALRAVHQEPTKRENQKRSNQKSSGRLRVSPAEFLDKEFIEKRQVIQRHADRQHHGEECGGDDVPAVEDFLFHWQQYLLGVSAYRWMSACFSKGAKLAYLLLAAAMGSLPARR